MCVYGERGQCGQVGWGIAVRSPGGWTVGRKKAELTSGPLGQGETRAPEGLKSRQLLQIGTHGMPLFPDWGGE